MIYTFLTTDLDERQLRVSLAELAAEGFDLPAAVRAVTSAPVSGIRTLGPLERALEAFLAKRHAGELSVEFTTMDVLLDTGDFTTYNAALAALESK